MRAALPILLSFLMAACNSTDMRDRPAAETSIEVARNYQAIYSDLRRWGLDCRQDVSIGAQAKVDAELLSDLGRAEISHYLLGGLGAAHIFRVEITRTSADRARVSVKRSGYGPDDTSKILAIARDGFGGSC